MEKKIELCGSELIALASSLAITLGKKFCKEDLRKLRFFFNSIATNIAIIESEGHERQKRDNFT